MTVYAQTPTFSATTMPALPTLPALPVQPGVTLPKLPADTSLSVPAAKSASIPEALPLPEVKLPGVKAKEVKETEEAVKLPAIPPIPESTVAGAAAAPVVAPIPAPTLPMNNLNGMTLPVPKAEAPLLAGLPIKGNKNSAPAPAIDEASALPEIEVVRDVAPTRSWETRLAPTYKPMHTNFKYRRQILPEAIYRTAYDGDNDHLPKRVTRDDYVNLLFGSVQRNDVEATRALLNAGTGINVLTADGQTPLAVARRAGATDVAQLLIARGAR